MNTTRSHHGFTLIELVLVMVVLVVALGITAPSLRGWSRGQVLRDAADQLVSVTHRARSQAVSEMRIYRVEMDARAGRYQLTMQEEQAFVSIPATWGRPIQLPAGVTMRFGKTLQNKAEQNDDVFADVFRFYPTGRTEPASVTFASDAGGSITVECRSPAEGFVVSGGAR